jgi:hypothetical protein
MKFKKRKYLFLEISNYIFLPLKYVQINVVLYRCCNLGKTTDVKCDLFSSETKLLSLIIRAVEESALSNILCVTYRDK